MKWPSIVSALLLLFFAAACKSKEKVVESQVTISRDLHLETILDDTLLIPWQLWTDCEVPAVPVVRRRRAQLTAVSKDTSFSVNKEDTTYKPNRRESRFEVFSIVTVMIVFFMCAAVMLRLFKG